MSSPECSDFDRRMVLWIVGIALLLLLTMVGVFLRAKPVPELPAAVEKTLTLEESQGATIRSFWKEIDDGQTIYEVRLRVNGENQDILVNPDGAIVGHEEDVAINALPAPIRDTLLRQAGQGRLTQIEAVIKEGKPVAYEAVVLTGGKDSKVAAQEAVVLTDGKLSAMRPIALGKAIGD